MIFTHGLSAGTQNNAMSPALYTNKFSCGLNMRKYQCCKAGGVKQNGRGMLRANKRDEMNPLRKETEVQRPTHQQVVIYGGLFLPGRINVSTPHTQ